ncbi:MAG: serine/threonine-protein kinase [Bacteroidota bacterium]
MKLDSIFNLASRYTQTEDRALGGSADVFICKDKHLGRLVAIKVVRNAADNKRINDEIKALMNIQSKHVVQAFDILIGHENSVGIVLEYIDGDELKDFDTSSFDEQETLKLLWQISDGICDIHKSDIIHRDLKLENMRIDNDGIIKIFDFGLSRGDGDDASTLGFKGTKGYAAPELYGDGIVDFDKAVDVYAFGILAAKLVEADIPDGFMAIPPSNCTEINYRVTKLATYQTLIEILNHCVASSIEQRPSIEYVRDAILGLLTKDQHQGIATINAQNYFIGNANKKIKISTDGLGAFEIDYNGFDFSLTVTSGDIYINAEKITGSSNLPGASVVTLGAETVGRARAYITFNVSTPVVVL